MARHLRSIRGGAKVPAPSLDAFAAELQRAHSFFNARYWGGRLAAAEITFVPAPPNARRPAAYEWWIDPMGGRGRSRILVYAKRALAAGLDATLQALLREMVSQWQHEHGDPPSRSDHHTVEWHTEAARVGLHTAGRAGATMGTPELERALRAFGSRLVLPEVEAAPTGGAKHKWICACKPSFVIYAARAGFSAQCNLCKTNFRPA